MEKDSRIGRRGWNEGVIGKRLELDDDETQDTMRLRSSIQVSAGRDPEPALEGLKRLLHERKQGGKRRRRETEHQRRRQEIVKEREQQRQDGAEKEMERQTVRPKMRIRFGRYKGRTCESIYKEDRNYCEWASRQESTNPALLSSNNSFDRAEREWENKSRKKRRALEEREKKLEEKRTATESELEERQPLLQETRDILAEMEAGFRHHDGHET